MVLTTHRPGWVLEALYRSALDLGDEAATREIARADDLFCIGGRPSISAETLGRVCVEWLRGNELRLAVMETLMETKQEAWL